MLSEELFCKKILLRYFQGRFWQKEISVVLKATLNNKPFMSKTLQLLKLLLSKINTTTTWKKNWYSNKQKRKNFVSLPKRITGTPCKYQCEKHMRQ